VIDPTEDELSFLRKLEEHGGQLALQGNMSLLKIDRLIPHYVTYVRASGLDRDGDCSRLSKGERRFCATVRRQGFLDRDFTELKESLAHQFGFRLLW
jgi:hypothetical protein